MSQNEVASIVNFLDKIEEETDKQQASAKTLRVSFDISKSQTRNQVTETAVAKWVAMKTELEQKDETIADLRAAVNKYRAENESLSGAHELNKSLKLKDLQNQARYQTVVKRYQQIIEQCEQLTTEKENWKKQFASQLEETNREWLSKVEDQKLAHERHLRSYKSQLAAAENAKRSAWKKEQIKSLKQNAYKSVQPEIQLLIDQKNTAVHKAEEDKQDALRNLRNRMSEQHHLEITEMKHTLYQERERLLDEERNSFSERMRNTVSQHQQEIAEEREKVKTNFERDLQNFREEAKREKDALLSEIARAGETGDEQLTRLQQEHSEALDALQRRNISQLTAEREKERIEREQWQIQLNQKMQDDLKQMESEYQRRVDQQRDAEIEHIIAKISSETSESTQKLRDDHATQMREVKSAHSKQMALTLQNEQATSARIAELADSLKKWQNKCSTLESEISNMRLQKEENTKCMKQMEFSLAEQVSRSKQVEGSIQQRLRDEHASEMAKASKTQRDLEQENLKLQSKIEEAENANTRLQQSEKANMEKFGEIISRKDEVIESLNSHIESLNSDVAISKQQRDDLMKQIGM